MAVAEMESLATEAYVERAVRSLRPEQVRLLSRLQAHLVRYADAYRLMA